MSKLITLNEIVEINPRIPKRLSADPEQKVSFVPMASVSKTGAISSDDERPLKDVMKGYTYFQEGDVLLAKITPCFENGKAAMVNGLPHTTGFGSTEFHVFRPGKDVDAKYLFYQIWNPVFRFIGSKNMTGTAGQKRLPAGFLKRHKIPLPPLAEQKRIADILDKSDAIRRKRQQAIKLADDFLRATFLDMFGDPVTNPKEWPLGSIRELISEAKYGTSKKASNSTGKYPILRMNNITYSGEMDFTELKYIDLEKKEVDKYLAKKGDLLFNRTNSKELVGKTAVFESSAPMAIAGYLIRVRTNERATPQYLSAYLNSSHGKATLVGMCKSIVGMANINAQELQDIKMLIPPVTLQKQYSEIVWKIRERKKRHFEAADIGDTLFNALTQRAFRGEL